MTLPAEKAADSAASTRGPSAVEILPVAALGVVLERRAAAEAGDESRHGDFHRARTLVERHAAALGGHLAEALGNEMLVLFGVRRMMPQPARQAIRAALALRRRLGGAMIARIGLTAGSAMVGPADFVSGACLEQAMRLARHAGAEEILLDPRAAKLLGRPPQGADAFRLSGPSTATPPDSAEPRLPLAGRRRELGMLLDLFVSVRDERSRAVAVIGGGGSGKSRLIGELRLSLGSRCPRFVIGSCRPETRRQPDQLVRELFGAAFGKDAEHARQRLGELRLPAEQREILVRWASFSAGDPPLPEAESDQVHAFALALLGRISRRHPVVLAVEDLQWIDERSQVFLSRLLEAMADEHLLLLLSWRPGQGPRLPAELELTQLPLRPLSAGETRQLTAAAFLQQGKEPEEVAQLAAAAEGNPGLAGILTRGDWTGGELSFEVRALLLDRCADLEPAAWAFLQGAAILGPEIRPQVLARLLGQPASFEASLNVLKRQELLSETWTGNSRRLVFRPRLLARAVLSTLPPGRSKDLHRRAAEALSELGAEKKKALVEPLIDHLVAAGDLDRARGLLAAQARDAEKELDFESAAAALGRAFELSGGAAAEQDFAGVDHLAELLVRLGRKEALFGLFAPISASSAEEPGAVPPKLHFWRLLKDLASGVPEEAARQAQSRLARAAAAAGDARSAGFALLAEAAIELLANRPGEAADKAERAIILFERSGDPLWQTASAVAAARAFTALGEISKAEELGRRAAATGQALRLAEPGFGWIFAPPWP